MTTTGYLVIDEHSISGYKTAIYNEAKLIAQQLIAQHQLTQENK
jgi:hypothetical protein